MQYISAGAVKQEQLRRTALQHLFLFDTTVDKAQVTSAIALKNVAAECRCTAHTLTSDVLAATPISGVKSNKFYPAHTGQINAFSVQSNQTWFYVSGGRDGLTQQDHADKFVTVSDSPVKSGWLGQTSNMLGSQTGYNRDNLSILARTYFMPPSRQSLYNGQNLMWQPLYPGNTFGGVTGEFTYTYSTSAAIFVPPGDSFTQLSGAAYPVGASYDGAKGTAIVLTPLANTGFLLLGPNYSYVRRYFANATWYTSYGAGNSWSAGNGNANGSTADIPYIGVNAADDPEASLAFGAVAINGQMGREMLIVDIGQDMTLLTDAQVGTEPQFKCSAQMLAQFSLPKLFEV